MSCLCVYKSEYTCLRYVNNEILKESASRITFYAVPIITRRLHN